MCERIAMTITDLRKELGLTLEAFATLLGLKSKGHVCQLEAGDRSPSVAIALKLEELSGGRMLASELNADVAKVRNADSHPQAAA